MERIQIYVLVAVLATGLIFAGAATQYPVFDKSEQDASDPGGSGAESQSWQQVTLEEVETGENFSIDGLDKHVVLQTFAVWCGKCDRQQRNKGELARQRDDFYPVSVNIDPNEDAQKIINHKNREGFDWRYAIAPAEMTDGLVNEFGQTMLNAPTSSVVIICEDGSTSGPLNGIQSSEELGNKLDEACL